MAQFERFQILVEMGVRKSRSAQLGNLFPMRGTTLPTNVPTTTQGQHRAWCVVQQLIKASPEPSHREENLICSRRFREKGTTSRDIQLQNMTRYDPAPPPYGRE